jgi:hypothetical protein
MEAIDGMLGPFFDAVVAEQYDTSYEEDKDTLAEPAYVNYAPTEPVSALEEILCFKNKKIKKHTVNYVVNLLKMHHR